MTSPSREIDIRNLQELFFRMEVDEDLFSRRMSDGICWWDIIRRDIYLTLHALHGGPFVRPDVASDPSLRSRAKDLAKPLLNRASRRYVKRRSPAYLFVTGQRVKQGADLVDNISDHLYRLMGDDALAIETMNKAAIDYRRLLTGAPTRLPPVAIRTPRWDAESAVVATQVRQLVNARFGDSFDAAQLVNSAISLHRQTRDYYRSLFAAFRPAAIVCINGGSLSGMFAAAKEAGVPTIELQHGASSHHTIFWSYPRSIVPSHPGLSLPTAYFTYADYWCRNTHYPVRLQRSIGNDSFFQKQVPATGNDVLVISSYMYREALLSLSTDLAAMDPDCKIFFKLHPHEYAEVRDIKARCAGSGNIEVVCGDPAFPELFESCQYVVAVHSTVVYTALQAKKRVCLLRQSNYFWHEDVFAYVELFDDAAGLHRITRDPSGAYFRNHDAIPEFFQPFDEAAFKRSLEEVRQLAANDSVRRGEFETSAS